MECYSRLTVFDKYSYSNIGGHITVGDKLDALTAGSHNRNGIWNEMGKKLLIFMYQVYNVEINFEKPNLIFAISFAVFPIGVFASASIPIFSNIDS
jgi:hypothetical protein